ncbi:MAG: hypothetical protein M1354_02760 [Candidatus Marsarchaeota archaeon]|jgi:hypothetical protein|nr:hypothetical protein [Candidatus Marsarchaeota archaeon]
MSGIFASQGAAELTTAAVLVLSAGLSAAMSVRCLKRRNRPLLFWSAGLWLFTFGALLELMFAGNIYSSFAAKAYLLVAAVLVGTLALGSIQLSKSSRIRKGYYLFFILSSAFLVYSLLTTSVGNLLVDYVVAAPIPAQIILASSVITLPAAAVLVVFAYKSYKARRDPRFLSIIVGVIAVSAAGGLYIVQYPSFLYVAEVAGILLLWYGFL